MSHAPKEAHGITCTRCGKDGRMHDGKHLFVCLDFGWPDDSHTTCANCNRALDSSGSDHCAECDAMYEAGVEAERARTVAWLRTTPRACGVLLGITASQGIARLATAIENGEHEVSP